jgi:hypothetical protein
MPLWPHWAISAGRRVLQPETEKSAKAKSMVIEQFRPFLEVEGINFISLQVPRHQIPRDMKIIDWMEHIDDFGDTANLIAELDLVISVDTAVAHLAGAMGKPTWNLVRFNGYWPWMLRATGNPKAAPTPWYPTMRMYQQPELGDWEPAVLAAQADLYELARRDNEIRLLQADCAA